ncbi:hypothetical protein CVT24_010582 [Panaeolus cyanescens]|uniref:G domain-containing protein n=1 Tax=Panaeolus cyanescens TaxID=181874 RepID=A0A409WDK3_9AGAR|nr:hypothetical protein CVT24_010582 [Panaeolus cyanescens]
MGFVPDIWRYYQHMLPQVPPNISEDDVVILLLGEAGSGRSSFIEKFTGQPLSSLLKDGSPSLSADTSKIRFIPCMCPEICDAGVVYFIDTPGFDSLHSKLTDTQMMRLIETWVQNIYKRQLSAVLYFHDITVPRVSKTAEDNINLVQGLISRQQPQRVGLVTTMWDLVEEFSMPNATTTEIAAQPTDTSWHNYHLGSTPHIGGMHMMPPPTITPIVPYRTFNTSSTSSVNLSVMSDSKTIIYQPRYTPKVVNIMPKYIESFHSPVDPNPPPMSLPVMPQPVLTQSMKLEWREARDREKDLDALLFPSTVVAKSKHLAPMRSGNTTGSAIRALAPLFVHINAERARARRASVRNLKGGAAVGNATSTGVSIGLGFGGLLSATKPSGGKGKPSLNALMREGPLMFEELERALMAQQVALNVVRERIMSGGPGCLDISSLVEMYEKRRRVTQNVVTRLKMKKFTVASVLVSMGEMKLGDWSSRLRPIVRGEELMNLDVGIPEGLRESMSFGLDFSVPGLTT